MERAQIPGEAAILRTGIDVAAQPGLVGASDHLLERRIGDQEIVEQTGPRRIGASELGRRRRAVRLGIAGIGAELRRDLVGCADDRIEAAELVLPLSEVPS